MATGSSQDSPQDRDESPPLAMLPGRRRFGGGLPIPLSSLVGRAQTIADIRAMLLDEEIRLLTLTGSGGTGKTRLALAAAAALEASGSFEDGIVFIPLASVRAPDDVAPAILTSLGLPLSTDRPPVAVLAAALRDRHVLLVLDNFEQVAAAGAAIAALLIDCPRVSALVTSRERLRVGGERVFPVHPLDLPRPEDDPATLSQREAIRLFMVLAEAANPNQSLISEINVIGEI